MKIRKIISVLMVLIMALVMLVGCGSNNNESKTQEKENEEIQDNDNENKNQNNESESFKSSCGNFVEYNGDLYYWKLTSDSGKSDGLWGNYESIANYQNTLIKRDANANEDEVFKDAGFGKLCLTTDKIFYDIETDNGEKVLSRDYTGENKTEYTSGTIKFAVNKYMYVQSNYDIVVINLENGSVSTVLKNAQLIGEAGDYIYYRLTGNEAINSLKIGVIINKEDMGIKATFNSSEYKSDYSSQDRNVSFVEFRYENNMVNITLGDIQGTAHMIQEGYVLQMEPDGSSVSKKELQVDEDSPEGMLDATEYSVKYVNKDLVYTNPKNGEKIKLMNDDDLYENFGFIGYSRDEEYTVNVYNACQIENDLYIVLDNGKHYEQGDIGWRYSYKRVKTVAFKYNLDTKNIEKIYEF